MRNLLTLILLFFVTILVGCSVNQDVLKDEIKQELTEELSFDTKDFNEHLIQTSEFIKSCTVTVLTTLPNSEEVVGSGLLYEKDNKTYHVLTNSHVISSYQKVEIYLPSNKVYYEAQVVREDELIDLAILEFETLEDLNICEIVQTEYNVGEMVLSVGTSTSIEYSNTVTLGIISKIDDRIQHDAAINSGSSGGPLFNLDGEVIGINVSKINTTVSQNQLVFVEGMSFCIKIEDIIEFLTDNT